MAHESMVEEWQPCKRFMEEVQEPDNEPKRGPWSRSEIAFREYGQRPDVEDEVGFSLREGFRSDYFRRVTMYSKHGLVHKYQEAPKSAGLKMFELFTEFIKEDKLAPDETREQFYYVNLSHVKNPCQGKKTKSSEATVALETWTQAVPGSEPTIGCITPEAAATLVQNFMANSKWIHRLVPVHGDQHVGNYHWGVKPDGTLTLKAFDFGHAFSASTHGDLSKFAEETRLYVEDLPFTPASEVFRFKLLVLHFMAGLQLKSVPGYQRKEPETKEQRKARVRRQLELQKRKEAKLLGFGSDDEDETFPKDKKKMMFSSRSPSPLPAPSPSFSPRSSLSLPSRRTARSLFH